MRDWLEPARSTPKSPAAPPLSTVRQVTGWLTRHPTRLTDDEQVQLKVVLEQCSELQSAAKHIRAFGEMLTHLRGQDLPVWIAAVRAQAEGLPGLAAFAAGLDSDLDAVMHGLTTRWNSGPVEGRVNHIKPSSGRCLAEPACRCCASGSCSPRAAKASRHRSVTVSSDRVHQTS